jgi:hypothetical protein
LFPLLLAVAVCPRCCSLPFAKTEDPSMKFAAGIVKLTFPVKTSRSSGRFRNCCAGGLWRILKSLLTLYLLCYSLWWFWSVVVLVLVLVVVQPLLVVSSENTLKDFERSSRGFFKSYPQKSKARLQLPASKK